MNSKKYRIELNKKYRFSSSSTETTLIRIKTENARFRVVQRWQNRIFDDFAQIRDDQAGVDLLRQYACADDIRQWFGDVIRLANRVWNISQNRPRFDFASRADGGIDVANAVGRHFGRYDHAIDECVIAYEACGHAAVQNELFGKKPAFIVDRFGMQ